MWMPYTILESGDDEFDFSDIIPLCHPCHEVDFSGETFAMVIFKISQPFLDGVVLLQCPIRSGSFGGSKILTND